MGTPRVSGSQAGVTMIVNMHYEHYDFASTAIRNQRIKIAEPRSGELRSALDATENPGEGYPSSWKAPTDLTGGAARSACISGVQSRHSRTRYESLIVRPSIVFLFPVAKSSEIMAVLIQFVLLIAGLARASQIVMSSEPATGNIEYTLPTERTFLLNVPAGYTHGEPLPLVLSFHGG